MRPLLCAVLAALAATCAVAAQEPGTCSPPGTATCDPSGRPIQPPAPVGPAPVPGGGAPPVAETAQTVAAVTATVTLGGGLAVAGAEGVAVDPATGLVYIGLNGAIVSGCDGDPTRAAGRPMPAGPGAGQMSILNPMEAREVIAVRTGQAPIWPTLDSARRLVYMMGSGGTGTVNVHNADTGALIRTIVVGGKPHMGGLDFSTGLMVVGNTVRASDAIAEQNHASVVDTNTNAIVREFETSPAPHGVVVDQEGDRIYYSAVGDGAIVAVSAVSGEVLYTGVPNRIYEGFGANNMLARQAATRRLFQVNAQMAARGILVVDEVTLNAEGLIRFNAVPWGMWVDEPNRLLFAALPNANTVGVVDLDTLTHVANVPVGTCPYAVVVDPERRIGVSSNQGSPTENATASIFDLCPVYAVTNRVVKGCPANTTLLWNSRRRGR
jgi:YVTN family beta-propeller protein